MTINNNIEKSKKIPKASKWTRFKKSALLERIIWIIIAYTTLLVVWQLLASFTYVGRFLPGPITVIVDFIRAFYIPIGRLTLIGHIGWSLGRSISSSVAAKRPVVTGISGVAGVWPRPWPKCAVVVTPPAWI